MKEKAGQDAGQKLPSSNSMSEKSQCKKEETIV
jgi:hypothetical protein